MLKIRGARQHNLKNINLDIPKNKLVVITGLSGSGKSSLAFDTIFAEGQRRYVESLSTYARQFLGVMEKPEVDLIEGLSPAIAINQKTSSGNPRSTVGTITEIYDYLRLLFARVGHPHCPKCHVEVKPLSAAEIVNEIIIKLYPDREKLVPRVIEILAPVVQEKKGEFKDLFINLKAKGFSEIYVDNQKFFLAKDEINLIKTNRHTIEVLIDRISLRSGDMQDKIFQANLKTRLTNAVETGLNLAGGLIILRKGNSKILFSEKSSCPICHLSLPPLEPRMFSFNSPLGACPACHGLGVIYRVDPNAIINPKLTLNEGGLIPFSRFFFDDTWYVRLLKKVIEVEKIDANIPLGELEKEKINILLWGTNRIYQVTGKNRFGRQTTIYEKFDGLVNELERRFFQSVSEEEIEFNKFLKEETCTSCHGKRLRKESLSVKIADFNIIDLTDLSINDLIIFIDTELGLKLSEFEKSISQPIRDEIKRRLIFLKDVGLGYLTLSRSAKTLSGGESQRIRLASQIGSGLTGVLYVLDEPSIGLHPRDVDRLINSLKNLRDLGNTLIVVEHDEETIMSADYIVELGPGAGKMGGRVVFQGDREQFFNSSCLTALYLKGEKKIEMTKRSLRDNQGKLIIKGASEHNLKKIDVTFPLGNLIGVTGVSGSGKSALVVDTLYPALKYYLNGFYRERMGKFERIEGYQYLDAVYLVDQSPIGKTPRSNPATYVKIFDEIRELFAQTVSARALGFNKSRFSFNLKGGRCEKCQGAGLLRIEMQFMSDIFVTCDVCQGKRYNEETLKVTFKGKTIYDVLRMSISEAADFFKDYPLIYNKLCFLIEVGLGYLELGQPATTLSGGESQRIKLAAELTKKNSGKNFYILDEPTTGLHFEDVKNLINVLNKLVEFGNTVVVIEHNLDVIKNCQWIIDLGPEGGENGGEIIFQGPTKEIFTSERSHTAKFLQKKFDF